MNFRNCIKRQFKTGIAIITFSAALAFMQLQGVAAAQENTETQQQEDLDRTDQEETQEQNRIYIISKKGDGDFTTIQEGVNAAESGDTLIIYPGTYVESVEIFDKTLNLVGVDRNKCILKYDASKYEKAPLIFAAGNVENLTIYGYGGEIQEDAYSYALTMIKNIGDYYSEEQILDWQSRFSGYAVHIDSDYLYGKNVYMKNCKIISNNNYCIGIGGRGKSSIVFEQCEFVSNGTGGCIYYHNTGEESLGGDAYFTLKECALRNYKCPYAISVHSMGNCNSVYLTFQNTKVKTIAYEAKHVYNSTNMNNMFDVDAIEALENQGKLYVDGFNSSLQSDMIMHLDKNKSNEYMKKLRYTLSESEEGPELSEGITYIMMVDADKEELERERLEEVKARKRYVVDIYNKSQLHGSGWCGLDSIYLTAESYGNTLIEMNYPIVD